MTAHPHIHRAYQGYRGDAGMASEATMKAAVQRLFPNPHTDRAGCMRDAGTRDTIGGPAPDPQQVSECPVHADDAEMPRISVLQSEATNRRHSSFLVCPAVRSDWDQRKK